MVMVRNSSFFVQKYGKIDIRNMELVICGLEYVTVQGVQRIKE